MYSLVNVRSSLGHHYLWRLNKINAHWIIYSPASVDERSIDSFNPVYAFHFFV